MKYSRKKLDLTGQRYGKLTVLYPAENISGRTAWQCRCDCGQEPIVRTSRLRSGHTSSCGCMGRAGIAGIGLTYVDGTCVEMLRAKTVRRNNTSGVPGVDWLRVKQRWRATICFKGKRHYLGSYDLFEDAVNARKRAEAELHDAFLREFAGGAAAEPAPVDLEITERRMMDMPGDTPPWERPAVMSVNAAGREEETCRQTIGNDGTQSQALSCP